MKHALRISLIFALLFISAQSSLKAATVSGTVYTTGGVYGATAVPAAGATVWIYLWPNGMNYVSTTTNSAGNYSITIPGTWPSGGGSMINLRDSAASGGCVGKGGQFYYYGSSIIHNDTLCNYTWYTLGGKVTRQGGAPAANAKVWWITEQQDTTGGVAVSMLQANDSMLTDANGDYLFVKRGYWILANQRVKAALQPSDPNYASYLPTYHDSSLVWSGAATFGSSAWIGNARNMRISLRGGANPGGPGFIAGDVLMGANKSTGVGDPLSSRVILLTTGAGQAVAYGYSDASGHFSFPNLPYGTYMLFGDAWGKTNPALTLTISAANPAVTTVVFEENNTTFKGHVNALGIPAGSALDGITVYPSPMEAYFEIHALQSIAGEKTAILRDVTGAAVSITHIRAGSSSSRIQTNELASGIYMLELQTMEGSGQYKLLKK